MIVASFWSYLPLTGHDHEVPWMRSSTVSSLQSLPATAANLGSHGLGVDAQVRPLTPCDGGRLDPQVLREGFGIHSLIVQSDSDSGLLRPEPVDNSDPCHFSVDN
jgi:hypothetical protein